MTVAPDRSPGAPGDGAPPPVLLHSLDNFAREILGCIAAVGARRIIEIGSETGGFSVQMLEWARANDALLVSVDPDPSPRLRTEAEGDPHAELVAGASPWALEEIERGDAYVIDGDHNYWTVTEELRSAFSGDGPDPLVVLHDVCWPCGRRDFYYAPDRLPPEAVHEHSFQLGVRWGESGLTPGGFRGAGSFACAVEEGGPRNGVLTAVEDFIEGHGELEYLQIPAVFGVGFLYPREARWADAVRSVVSPLDDHPLLQRLEQNRHVLYERVLDLQDELGRSRVAADRVVSSQQAEIGRLQAEHARLLFEAANAEA